MKKSIILFALVLIVSVAHSQNEEDYTNIVDVIKKSYNTKDSTLVATHFDKELQHQIADQKAKAFVAEDELVVFPMDHANDGKIITTDLIMNGTDSNVYYIEFEKNAKILTVGLSDEKQITALQLEDY